MAELTKENLTADTVKSLRDGKEIVENFHPENVNETDILKFIQKGDEPTVARFDENKYNYYTLITQTSVKKYTGGLDILINMINTGADAVEVLKSDGTTSAPTSAGGRRSKNQRKSRNQRRSRKQRNQRKSRRSRR
jgi:hypothetical protein